MVYYLGYQAVGDYRASIRNLDGDPLKVEIADTTPDDGLNTTPGASNAVSTGRPIETEHVPTLIEWQGDQAVPDIDQLFGMLTVSDHFKEIVERFESNVHQFLPVEFVTTDGRHLASRWFFIVCKRIDSVDREHSTMFLSKNGRWNAPKRARRRYPDEVPDGFDATAEAKYVFNNGQIGEIHIWCDKFMNGKPWLSDKLGQALIEGQLSGLFLTSAESV